MIEAARNALHAGADWFAVARTGEGVSLRQAGMDAPVLVLGESDEAQIDEGVRHRLTLTVCTPGVSL
jgi:alanine racemase